MTSKKMPFMHTVYDRPFIKHTDHAMIPPHEMFPGPWLPTDLYVGYTEDRIVLRMGRIVSAVRREGTHNRYGGRTTETREYLVYANQGTAHTLTYTAQDIGVAEDLDVSGVAVASDGASSTQLPGNYAIGWLEQDQFTTFAQHPNWNLQYMVPVLMEGAVEFPHLRPSDQSFAFGDLVVPKNDGTGLPVPYTSGVDIRHVVGKVYFTGPIQKEKGLSLVETAPGHNLSGKGTEGVEQFLYAKRLDDASQLATMRSRVKIGF